MLNASADAVPICAKRMPLRAWRSLRDSSSCWSVLIESLPIEVCRGDAKCTAHARRAASRSVSGGLSGAAGRDQRIADGTTREQCLAPRDVDVCADDDARADRGAGIERLAEDEVGA